MASTTSVVSAFLRHRILALSPGPAQRCARGPDRVGQGLLWATSACSGPALGNGLWRGGPGPPPCLHPSPFLPAVMPVAVSSTPLFNSGVVCGENPRSGHTVTWPAWASAASGDPCPCLSGGRVHTLVLRLAAFPLCSLPEVPPPRFLLLAVVPGNSGAGVRSNWRACIVAGGLCLTLGRGAGVLVDLPLGAWCHGARVPVPLCSRGPWPWSRGCPLFFRAA